MCTFTEWLKAHSQSVKRVCECHRLISKNMCKQTVKEVSNWRADEEARDSLETSDGREIQQFHCAKTEPSLVWRWIRIHRERSFNFVTLMCWYLFVELLYLIALSGMLYNNVSRPSGNWSAHMQLLQELGCIWAITSLTWKSRVLLFVVCDLN